MSNNGSILECAHIFLIDYKLYYIIIEQPRMEWDIPSPFLSIPGRTRNGTGMNQEWTRTYTRDFYDIPSIQDS